MSPEQMSSTRNVDMRTDIWALGVILYETLTGRVPFDAETMPQLCGMILQDPPRPLRDLRPDVPESLQAVVLHCLEKNREHRFANVAELAFALAPYGAPVAQRSADRISRVLGAAGIPSTPPAVASAASVRMESSTHTNFGASGETKKSRTPLLLALLAAVVLLGGLGWFATHRHAPVDSAAEPLSSKPSAAVAVEATPPTPAPAQPPAPVVTPEQPSVAPPVVASAKPAVVAAHGKPKAVPAKPKSATPEPAAPAIDPLDGRR